MYKRQGKDLATLQDQLAPTVRHSMSRAAADLEKQGLTTWSFGDLPDTFEKSTPTRGREGARLQGFPALVDEGASVAVQVLALSLIHI